MPSQHTYRSDLDLDPTTTPATAPGAPGKLPTAARYGGGARVTNHTTNIVLGLLSAQPAR
jgi:hypothetical protein